MRTTTYANRPSASIMRRLIAIALTENETRQYSRHEWETLVTHLHTGDLSVAGSRVKRHLKEIGEA